MTTNRISKVFQNASNSVAVLLVFQIYPREDGPDSPKRMYLRPISTHHAAVEVVVPPHKIFSHEP